LAIQSQEEETPDQISLKIVLCYSLDPLNMKLSLITAVFATVSLLTSAAPGNILPTFHSSGLST
jgi:hypothetical protein